MFYLNFHSPSWDNQSRWCHREFRIKRKSWHHLIDQPPVPILERKAVRRVPSEPQLFRDALIPATYKTAALHTVAAPVAAAGLVLPCELTMDALARLPADRLAFSVSRDEVAARLVSVDHADTSDLSN